MTKLIQTIFICYIFSIGYVHSQLTITIGLTKHTINGSLICSYPMNNETQEIYIQVKNDTLESNYLSSKDKVYTSRLHIIAPIASLDLVFANTNEVTLNSEEKKGGMMQISTYRFEKRIVHEYYNDKNEVSIDTSENMNILFNSLNDATYWRWKISTLLKTPLPNQKVWVKNTSYTLPAIPIFYSSEKNKNGDYDVAHHYYNVKNDSIFYYKLFDLEPYSGTCAGIGIEKAPLSQISKKNMVVRKPESIEYSIGPEKNSYLTAIGTPGKFIVTDFFHTGNYKSELQQAMLLVVCANQEIATAVYNEILKAAK